VILLFTLIHLRGIVVGARIQNYLTVLKVGLILGLLFLGFLWGNGSLGHFAEGGRLDLNFGGWRTIGLSLMWIMFAYSGWNASTYIGSEIRDPSRNLPFSLIAGTCVVTLLYLSLNLLFVYAVGPEEMKGVISIGGLAMASLFGGSMETIFSLLISFALFSSLSAFIILGPRVYFSMAKDGYFFRSIAEVHPRFLVPAKSLVLQAAISIIMVLSGTFDQVLTYMGFSLGIFPIVTVLGVFRLPASERTKALLPGYPAVPLVYAVVGLLILILAFLERPTESSIALLTVLIGIPVFVLFKRRYHDRMLPQSH